MAHELTPGAKWAVNTSFILGCNSGFKGSITSLSPTSISVAISLEQHHLSNHGIDFPYCRFSPHIMLFLFFHVQNSPMQLSPILPPRFSQPKFLLHQVLKSIQKTIRRLHHDNCDKYTHKCSRISQPKLLLHQVLKEAFQHPFKKLSKDYIMTIVTIVTNTHINTQGLYVRRLTNQIRIYSS
jgi:hypothetical protein